MAPQTSIPLAANILGTVGTDYGVFSSFRIWHNWKSKNTEGLPGLMLFFWAAAGVPLGVYTIVQNFNIPLQIQPQMFCSLALICWGQSFVYSKKWKPWAATLLVFGTGISFAGIELVLVFTLRGPYSKGVDWPVTMVGVTSTIFLAVGLIPPYFELWKRQGRVIGIDFIFLTMDWSGAFFSLMALVAQHTFDILGGVSYILCLLLETGIFTSHAVWLYRTRRIRKAAKLAGKTYDQYISNDEKATDNPTQNSSTPPVTPAGGFRSDSPC